MRKAALLMIVAACPLFVAVTGRLFMQMCAHAAFELTAIAIIYWNVESAVAHLIFR